MAERTGLDRLDQPREVRRTLLPRFRVGPDTFGRISEGIARFLGTPRFLLYLTLFCLVWLAWNSFGPADLRFDKSENGFTALTLMLSLQASYAAPLILLAQNRQADRDRVSQEEDRAQNARLQADVEYLTRELASLRTSLGEVATRDFLRDQLREVTDDIVARTTEGASAALYDRQKRAEREERERRAERKRRRDAQRETSRDAEQPVSVSGLGDPFVGDEEAG